MLEEVTYTTRSAPQMINQVRSHQIPAQTRTPANCGVCVNHVPVLTGGVGRRQLQNYYERYFIPGQPPDVEIVLISRTVSQERIVDEFVYR
jgi:hypothetical protein